VNGTPRLLRLAALGASLVSVATLASTASAQPANAVQRVAIEQKLRLSSASGSFVLRILGPGALRSDTGTFTHRAGGLERVALHNGQGVAAHVVVTEFVGRRGMFAIRQRLDLVAAGNGHMVATGTWRVVLGTGAYAHLAGSGRLATVVTSSGVSFTQFEGYLRILET
jgi:hypothetical protein